MRLGSRLSNALWIRHRKCVRAKTGPCIETFARAQGHHCERGDVWAGARFFMLLEGVGGAGMQSYPGALLVNLPCSHERRKILVCL